MTTNYHLYAIGNALIDYEYEVSDTILRELGIDKGAMALIDEARLADLQDALQHYPHILACGGSAANSTMTLQQLGGQSYYCCRLGNDDAGDFFYQELINAGIACNMHPHQRAIGISGKCIAKATPDAERSMSTYLGVSAELSLDNIDEHAIARSQYLYIEGYLVTSPSALDAAMAACEIAKQHQVSIALGLADINVIHYAKAGLDHILQQGIDVLFANEQEAFAYTDTHDLRTAAQRLNQLAKTVLITRNAKGAIVSQGDQWLEQPGFAINAVDSMGAGDVFAGTVLYGLTQDMNLSATLELACYASAQVVTKLGPRLTPQQITQIKNFLRE